MDVKTVPIDSIRPYDKNPRKNDAGVDKVAASIKEFGFQQPIVADKDGVIIVGHTRFKAAIKMGLKEIPVLFATELNAAQVQAYRLADNKTNEFSEWDMDLLLGEIGDLQKQNFDMGQFGFELDAKEATEDEFDMDEAVAAVTIPTTKPGDIWTLGRHRLLCADSTDTENIKRLMAGRKADLLLTDPPYNVNYTGATKDELKIKNDNMGDARFKEFLTAAFKAADDSMKPGTPFYIWHADTEGLNFRLACREAGWQIRQCLIWNKNAFVMGHQDYQWKHEPCLYGWKDGAGHYFIDDRTQSTVIEDKKIDFRSMKRDEMLALLKEIYSDKTSTTIINEDRPSRSAEHPTMKPLKLLERLIKNSTRPGDLILDTFGGSGSTMMCAEQLDRGCNMMEIDPVYCDVIVTRWEKLTGNKAARSEAV